VSVEGAEAFKRASVVRLTGPSLESKIGVRLGDAEVSPSGEWRAGRGEELRVEGGKMAVRVPAASAAVVTLRM